MNANAQDDATAQDTPKSQQIFTNYVSNAFISPIMPRPVNKSGTNSWAAGLFDGGGWIRVIKSFGKKRVRYTLTVYIELPHIGRGRELVGLFGGAVGTSKSGKTVWRIQANAARVFLTRIKAYVHWKREPINDAARFFVLKSRFRRLGHALPPDAMMKFERIRVAFLSRSGTTSEQQENAVKMAVEADLKRMQDIKRAFARGRGEA